MKPTFESTADAIMTFVEDPSTMDQFFAYARRLTAFVWGLTGDERLPEDVREGAKRVLETATEGET